MSSSRDLVKRVLPAIESLQLTLQAADKDWAEIDRINGVLAARKNELTEAEEWLRRTRVAAEEATKELDELRARNDKEEKRITAKIDALKAEMLKLEKQVSGKRTELDSVTAGMAALHKRLSVRT